MNNFCENIFYKKRLNTINVNIGGVNIGNGNPIAIQSMLNVPTTDIKACISQILELESAGCDIVRLAVPNMESVKALSEIRDILVKKGVRTPIVADVHFNPKLAMEVVDFTDKVRINPGNYCEKVDFSSGIMNEQKYSDALKHIEEEFSKLIEALRKGKKALRIGSNHGSLSQRIMLKYGNTPAGMVESAIEYLNIATKLGFHNIVFSMKSSTPRITIEAYRLLVKRMREIGTIYPLHLGVTEAGSEVDGRVKSAVGIGALLEDGIGDTIRVSLTENPVHEIPVAKDIVNIQNKNHSTYNTIKCFMDNFSLKTAIKGLQAYIGKLEDFFKSNTTFNDKLFIEYKLPYSLNNARRILYDNNKPVHILQIDKDQFNTSILGEIENYNHLNLSLTALSRKTIAEYSKYACKFDITINNTFDLKKSKNILNLCNSIRKPLQVNFNSNNPDWFVHLNDILEMELNTMLIIGIKGDDPVHSIRLLLKTLLDKELHHPICYIIEPQQNKATDNDILELSMKLGNLLIDKLIHMVSIRNDVDCKLVNTVYDILQASGILYTRAEIVSCPACARTVYDIQSLSHDVKETFGHLRGIKIAVMGCRVNGIGEMGDADFGFIGSGQGKVDMYKKKEVIKKHIDLDNAIVELKTLLKNEKIWVEINN